MKRTPTVPDLENIPDIFHPLLRNTAVLDSSCSRAARVWFLDTDGGLYLKSTSKGHLKQEAELDSYFHSFGMGPEVLTYTSLDRDWLLTRAVPGEDCTHQAYCEDPKRLAELTATILRDLHSRDSSACPVQDHTARRIAQAAENYAAGRYDTSLFPDNWGYTTPEEAWAVIEANAKYLKTDTLLHGDYCLPNIMLDNWKPTGFIDLGSAGVGDRNVDIFWGKWSLNFNLKTDRYCDRFLDAYGRENMEEDLLRVVAALEVFL